MKKHRYQNVLYVLRRSRGLGVDDSSEDAEISKMTPEKAFASICAWHLGGTGVAYWIKAMLKNTGHCVTVKRKKSAALAKGEA